MQACPQPGWPCARGRREIALRPWPPEKPPVKTAGSFCPCATTLFDYIRGDGARPARDGARPAADSLRTGNLTGNFSGVFRRSGILARNSARFTRGRPAARCTLRCDGRPPAATRSGQCRCPAAGRRRRRPPQSGRDPRRGRRRGHGWSGAVFWRRRGVRRRRHGRAGGVAPGFIALASLPVFGEGGAVGAGWGDAAVPCHPHPAARCARVHPPRRR